MTGYSWSTPVPVMAMPALGVNGPEDDVLDWDAVDWRVHEDNVRRLRQRIFTATQEGDWPKVRNLQKLMLRSRSNTLFSVRQVTQRNAGRKTAGIDGRGRVDRPRLGPRWRCVVHSSIRTWTPAAGQARVHPEGTTVQAAPLGIPTEAA